MGIAFTYLPGFVTLVLRGLPIVWRGRHRLMLCWLIFLQAVHPGRKTLAEMARWTPAPVTAWRFGRLRKATYGNVPLRVRWVAQERLATWPAPRHGVWYLLGDGRHADQRGPKHPVAQQGRARQDHPGFFGRRFVRLRAAGDGSRVPVGFRRMLPQCHVGYRSEKALFREMGSALLPPHWAQLGVVGGDAASGSQAHMPRVPARDRADTARQWGLVFAIARTWKTVEDKALKDLVTHLPRKYYQRIRVPRLPGAKGCKTFWVYSICLCLRHIGDVTVVLSKRGRNLGPKQTKILVTNLDEWIPRQVVGAYQRRWPVEQINRELKTDLGLGAHQVRGEEGWIEKSFGMAVLAYLFLIRVCHEELLPGTSWSIGQLQHALRLRIITNQVEHNVKARLTKVRKGAYSLALD
jgi:hypothetical protein